MTFVQPLSGPTHALTFPEILNSQAAADLLRVHLTTIQELARRGKIPCRKVGKDYRFYKDALIDWLYTAEEITPNSRRKRR